jgi:hypothetical protein
MEGDHKKSFMSQAQNYSSRSIGNEDENSIIVSSLGGRTTSCFSLQPAPRWGHNPATNVK